MYIYCFLEIVTFYNEYISSDNKKQMIYFKFYKRLSAGITASQMLPLISGFAALALQPELAASFSWAQSTLSMPPLVHFPRSTGLLVTTFRWYHVLPISVLMLPCTGPGKPQALGVVGPVEVHGIARLQPSQLVCMGWVPLLLGGVRASWMVWAESAVLLAQTLAPFFGMAPELRSSCGSLVRTELVRCY